MKLVDSKFWFQSKKPLLDITEHTFFSENLQHECSSEMFLFSKLYRRLWKLMDVTLLIS